MPTEVPAGSELRPSMVMSPLTNSNVAVIEPAGSSPAAVAAATLWMMLRLPGRNVRATNKPPTPAKPVMTLRRESGLVLIFSRVESSSFEGALLSSGTEEAESERSIACGSPP